MANLPSPDSSLYIISPDQKARYDAQFKKICPSSDYLSGEQAKGIMLQSGLPPVVLANIWSMADVDADGRMDINEFSIALHLIALKLKGIEVPRTLPSSLRILVEPPPAFAAFNDQPPMNNTPSRSSLVHTNSISPSTSMANKMGSMGNLASQASPKVISTAEWAIPQQSKLKYTQLFNTNDRSRSGFLSGIQARNILLESKLPQAKLAQVWNLSDVDADGRLTCEEFVLAMFLIDKANANEPLPAKLTPELVPPSYRRASTSGTLSHASSIDDPLSDSNDLSSISKSSFEDKRRENYEKGQAELDRRRAALAEQQKRERDERERKEREENARKEKERLEAERKKQEEIERAQQRLREQELEKEEAKRRANEVRELARKEMERQRQRELDQARRQELVNARGRILDEVQKLKSRRKALKIEHEQIDKRIVESKTAAQTSRDKVVKVKLEIDGMRSKRDATLARQEAIRAEMKLFTEKNLLIEQEKVKLSSELKTLFANASNGINSEQQITNFASMLQAKQLAINQLRAHLERFEVEYKTKREDVINGKQELESLRRKFEMKRALAKSYNGKIESKRQEAERVRDSGAETHVSNATPSSPEFATSEVEVMSVPQFDWPVPKTTQTAFTPTTMQTKFKYRCIYGFEGRNKDEITIKPGDIVMVDTSAASEPDWVSGEINGKTGWCPQGYLELVDENGTSANAIVDNEIKDPFANFGAAHAVAGDGSTDKAVKQARALYDCSATEEGHMSFMAGDLIRITEHHDNWYFGELVDPSGNVTSSGWCPENYLEMIPGASSVATVAPVAPTGESADSPYYIGLYAFESPENGDLEFGVDELILVESKDGEWWSGVVVDRATGKLDESRRGIFPSNFVGPASAADIPSAIKSAAPAPAVASAPALVAAAPIAKEPAVEVKTHQLLDRKESEPCESPKPKKGKSKKMEVYTAIAAYTATSAEQLSIEIGQLVQVRKKMASGWWEGEVQAKGKKKQVGWVPASFLKPLGGAGAVGGASVGSAGSSARNTPEPVAKAASDEPEIERVEGLYTFKAEREDEISIELGDTIRVLSKPDPTWWRGHNTRTGAIGLFPSNHVRATSAGGNTNYYDATNGHEEYAAESAQEEIRYDEVAGSVYSGDDWADSMSVTDYRTCSTAEEQQLPLEQGSHQVDSTQADHQYRDEDSFDDDDDEEEEEEEEEEYVLDQVDSGVLSPSGAHTNAGDIPSLQYHPPPTGNGTTTSSQYYSDDSFDSDDEDDGAGDLESVNGHNQPGDRSSTVSLTHSPLASSTYRKSPQLYTVRIMDLERSNSRASSQSNLNTVGDRSSQYRLNIIYELITTEEAYIKDLYFTLEHFRKPLQDCRLFAEEEISSFFSHLDEIYEVNYDFYNDLNQRLQSEGSHFCDILLSSLQQMLPVYTRFCSAQMTSSRQLQLKLESDVQFSEVLLEISKRSKSHLPLNSYLLKPMQRITKYPLLIEKLFDSTPSSHVDFRDAEAAVKFAKSFCKQINEACRDTENFEKLIWMQKHITIPPKNLDYVIDFNSETQFLGPRTLLHSGILVKASSSKILVAFLFNDFFLLAMPNKKFQKSLNGHNFFYNKKALEITYTMYRKPLLLNEFTITDLPEFESNLDPGLFRIYINSQKRHLSLRTNSVNECVLWMKQIDKAKRSHTEIQRRLNSNENISPIGGAILPNQAPIANLFVTIVEALQLYTRNYALNAYCKVGIGKEFNSIHLTKRTKVVRLEITSKNTLSGRKARENGVTKDGTFKITWNANFKINLSRLDETLFISCYDENPYAPHMCIGEASIPLEDIVQQRRYVSGPITKDVQLRIPNVQLSKNLLNNYKINPSVLLKYDLLKFGEK